MRHLRLASASGMGFAATAYPEDCSKVGIKQRD